MKKFLSLIAVSSLFALCGSALAKGKPSWAAAAKPGKQSIVQIVLADDGKFDVLQAAVVAAGLADALGGKGQYTVFAPTDEAFIAALEASDEADAIAKIEATDPEVLSNILLYHVTEGRRNSRSVLAAPRYTMLNGMILTRDALLEAGISAADISASNGIIHVIDSVLLP